MRGDTMQCCYREQVAYALFNRFKVPKLYKYAASGDWDLIPARCRSHPKEAAYVHKYAPNDTALHRLFSYHECHTTSMNIQDETTLHQLEKWKWEAVVALLEANRELAATPDVLGRTPLHLACMDICVPQGNESSSSTSSFRKKHVEGPAASLALLLAQANPRAASLQDLVEQRTPVHYLIGRNDGELPLQLLHHLLEYYPAALNTRDITGETPADIVARRGDEIVNADQVLKVFGGFAHLLQGQQQQQLPAPRSPSQFRERRALSVDIGDVVKPVMTSRSMTT